MGTLGGHVIPGVFFIIWGSLWTWSSIWLYISTKFNLRSRRTGPYSEDNIDRKAYIPLSCVPRLPVDPLVKLIFGGTCFLLELFFVDGNVGEIKTQVWTLYGKDHQFGSMVRLHHLAMECGYMVSAIVDLLSLCIRYPKRTPYVFLTLAFAIQFSVFYFHVNDDRSDLDILAHVLLNYSVAICLIFSLLRTWQPANVLFNTGLSVGLILQGTWFIQVGVVIYGPHKWTGTMNEKMFLSGSFLFQLLGIAVGVFLVYTIVQCCVQYYVKKKQRPLYCETQDLMTKSENDEL